MNANAAAMVSRQKVGNREHESHVGCLPTTTHLTSKKHDETQITSNLYALFSSFVDLQLVKLLGIKPVV